MDTSHWQKARQSRDPRFDGLFLRSGKKYRYILQTNLPCTNGSRKKTLLIISLPITRRKMVLGPVFVAGPIVPLAAQHGRVQKRLHLEQNS